MRQLERRVTLSVLDRKWREHLYEMDYLKEGIGLRAMAQRDPLVEYQREGFQLFNAMNDSIKEETIGYLFNLEVQVQEADAPASPITLDSIADAQATPGAAVADRPVAGKLVAKGIDGPEQSAPLQYSAPSVDGDGEVVTRSSSPAAKNGWGRACAGRWPVREPRGAPQGGQAAAQALADLEGGRAPRSPVGLRAGSRPPGRGPASSATTQISWVVASTGVGAEAPHDGPPRALRRAQHPRGQARAHLDRLVDARARASARAGRPGGDRQAPPVLRARSSSPGRLGRPAGRGEPRRRLRVG